MKVALVLGAGGGDGGRFIDGALSELAATTGFAAEYAHVVIGTSVGAFRAAGIGSAVDPPPDVVTALQSIALPRPKRRLFDRMVRRFRLFLGRLLARLTPRGRPTAEWRTPSGPHHPGAVVVSVDLDRYRRVTHRLVELDDTRTVVRASAAVPFATGPVIVDGSPNGDGAIWSPTNADLAATADDDVSLVIVVAPMVRRSGGSPLDWLHRHQLRAELAELSEGTSVIVVKPGPGARAAVRTLGSGVAAVRDLSVR